VNAQFHVNIRTPRLASRRSVALKSREIGVAHWDDALTLEFGDRRPAVSSVTIAPAPGATTVFLAGDSTVTDQTAEGRGVLGQMIPRFFAPTSRWPITPSPGEKPPLVQSGERRLEKNLRTSSRPATICSCSSRTDNQKAGPTRRRTNHSSGSVVADTRARPRHSVLVTSMDGPLQRAGAIVDSLGAFPEAMRRVAHDDGVALIDLTPMSRRFYEALGPEGSKRAFVAYPAGMFQPRPPN